MKYIFAYDGGGTKTRLIVCDNAGTILFDSTTTGSNIYSIGDEAFVQVIQGLFEAGKKAIGISNRDISLVYLGLSGADLEEDYKTLYETCKPIFEEVRYIIQNDAWIVLRSGLKTSFGAVAICGTGTNSAAINHKGDRAILRALSYILGTYGGGLDIAREALHYAFRADELTYQDTMLRTEIPRLFGKKRMEDCIPLFYPTRVVSKQKLGSITPLVAECANEGDEVSQMILQNVAKHIALQTVGVMKQVEMGDEDVNVVVGGRVFTINAPLFISTFTETLQQYYPQATIIQPPFAPVVGAYLFALDELGIPQTPDIEQNLKKSGGTI